MLKKGKNLNDKPSEIIVLFELKVSPERAKEIIAEVGSTVLDGSSLDFARLVLVSVPEDSGLMETVDKFSSYPEVIAASPNSKMKLIQ